ncbi:MAG TPA: tetratricopeptide repeat protein [Bryobacteraceae bacterium]|nr:tetratricopeptide repeat protein [Bryobacteraceae bacterium]
MLQQGSTIELAKDAEAKVMDQLNRVLGSKAFRQADRLKRFLSFIVEETVAGRGERLKEFVVGVEVFGKPESFDPRNDPIVRVQARRLRAQLTRYYREEAPDSEMLIELPKGGYAPVFRQIKSAPTRRIVGPTLVSRNTAVVIPFLDHSVSGDQEYFCEGLTQEIIHAIAGAGEIRLVAWTEGAPAGAQTTIKTAADWSNAALIVTGSVRKAGNDARITMNLIDAASGCYLWSSAVDRTLDNIFAVQEEVAGLIVEQLKRELIGGAQSGHVRRATENLAAYNLYVQGRYHVNQRTEEGLRRAVELFEKAIVENAQYSQAYSGLSDAYGLLGHYGVLAPAQVWTKAASNAAWAVLQDENSAEAHTSLAHVKSTQDWDWLGAEHEYQRAIALDPRYPTAHHWYAMSCLTPLARLDQACEELMLAQALDPISSIIGRDLARIYYYKQDYDAALEQCDHTIELNPHFSPAYWILGLVQEQRGDFDESAAAFQRAIQLSPGSPLMKAALGRTFALSGKQSDALRILRELHELAEKRYVSPFELAAIYFALGQTNDGFQWLAKAFQDRCFELICLRVDPRWESLRGNPQFQNLFAQLGLS